MRLPTISRVTAHHVTRHNISSQGEVLPKKFSCFIRDLEDPEMKQNIAFQALKPFIPPENRELYAESLTEDLQKHVTVKKVKATPREKAKKKDRKSCPCPLPPAMRSSSDSPQPPFTHTSSPSTAAICISGQESSTSGTKSTIKNQSALSTHTPVGDSGQCTHMEICIKTGNTKDPTESCVERLKLSGAKEPKKEILKSSSPTQKLKNHMLDLWKKPYESGSIQ